MGKTRAKTVKQKRARKFAFLPIVKSVSNRSASLLADDTKGHRNGQAKFSK